MLQRLYDPTQGQVLVDGVDLREVDSAWFRSQIGVVDQDPRLFAESIAANIAYSMEELPQVGGPISGLRALGFSKQCTLNLRIVANLLSDWQECMQHPGWGRSACKHSRQIDHTKARVSRISAARFAGANRGGSPIGKCRQVHSELAKGF